MAKSKSRIALSRVFKLRDKLTALMTQCLAMGYTQASRRLTIDALYRHYQGKVSLDTLTPCVEWLAGTQSSIRDLAWALAGNQDRLVQGESVFPGVWGNTEPVFVPVQVLQVFPKDTHGRHTILMRVLAGYGCPGRVETRWTVKAFKYYASHPTHGIGFTYPRYTVRQPVELTLSRFYAQVSTDSDTPRVTGIRITPALLKYNQALHSMRSRLTLTCPYQFRHVCGSCPVGYDRCPVGTRPVTDETRFLHLTSTPE
jgi:hypothetical protein